MADVFISYKSERRQAARHLEQTLIRYGYSVWFDHALVRGHDYEDQIQRKLDAAKAVIVLWCSLSVESQPVRSEAQYAKDEKKQVPLKIEPCKLPLFSTLTQYIDLTQAKCGPRDGSFDPLLDDLERLVGQPPHADLKALREFEANWKTGGSHTLATFPLESKVVPATQPQPAHLTLAAQEWPSVRDSRDPRRLARFEQHFAGTYFADEARALREEIEAEQQRVAKVAEVQKEREQSYRSKGLIFVDAKQRHGAPEGWFHPGSGKTEWFQDLDIGPEMVIVPPGSFQMGEPGQQREVTIPAPFAVGKYAITFAEWDAAQVHPDWRKYSGIAARQPNDYKWGRGRHPVIDVNWDDATAYAAWLTKVSGQPYRLPSEAEWEYCCRAGTRTAYSFGETITKKQAHFSEGTFGSAKQTIEVGSLKAPNPFGLHDMHGNVWEWCEDIWHDSYNGAPTDGTAWMQDGDATRHGLRGGSWIGTPDDLRCADRNGSTAVSRFRSIGFRVVRSVVLPRTL